MKPLRLAPLFLVLVAACDCFGPPPGGSTATVLVDAESGGTITLDDGTSLVVPPGALAEDTEITVTSAGADALTPEGMLAGVILQPDGLEFSAPATLTIPWAGVVDVGDVAVVMASSLNEQRDVPGQRDAYALVEADVDETRAVVDVEHFSVFAMLYFPQMYVAPILPGKYLRSGDILYTLTGAVDYKEGSNLPIHVGMYVDDETHDRVIESTLPDEQCTPTHFSGVEEHAYGGAAGLLHLCGSHVFLGARRPTRSATIEEGVAAVRAARALAGTAYGVLGFDTRATGMTCVQLVEDAWEAAGVNISLTPDTLLTPANQMGNTTPVKDITIDVADAPVRIPIVAAVRVGKATYTAGGASAGRVPVTMTPSSPDPALLADGKVRLEAPQLLPGDAALPAPAAQAAQDLVLRPTTDDVGFTWLIDLAVDAPDQGFTRPSERFLRVQITSSAEACPITDTLRFSGPFTGSTSSGAFSRPGDDCPEFEASCRSELSMIADSDGDGDLFLSFGNIRGSTSHNGDFYVAGDWPYHHLPGVRQVFTFPATSSLLTTAPTWTCKNEGGEIDIDPFDHPEHREATTGTIGITLSADCATATIDVDLTADDNGAVCTIQGTMVGALQ